MLKSRSKAQRQKDKLTPSAKCYVIRSLAQFITPTEICETLKKEFSISITPAAITYTKIRYKKTIAQIRRKFCDDILSIPIANKSYRLIELGKIYRAADRRGAEKIRLRALKLAADEIGENFEKLAKAINNSGGNNIVNIIESTDRSRIIEERAAVLGFERTGNRF